jgi:hypothetical protein
VAGAEDRATQGCDLSADLGAGMEGARDLAPAVPRHPGKKAINPGVLGAKPPEVSFRDIPVHRSPPFLRLAIIFLCAPVPGVHGVDDHRKDGRGERRWVSARSRLDLLGRPWWRFGDRLKERPLLFLLLHPLLNEVAVVHQFADQGIDLL